MVAQTQRDGADLGVGRGGVGVVLRRLRAPGHEILPHENAALVAPVVERIGLVDAAAPDAHQVAVRLFGERERFADPRRLAARDRVRRHPVRAADVDRLAVHAEEELAGPVRAEIVVALQLHRAEADAPHVARERLARRRIDHFDRRVVEGLAARAGGPPEVEAGGGKFHAGADGFERAPVFRDRRPAAGRADRKPQLGSAGEVARRRGDDLEVRAHPAATRAVGAAPVVARDPERFADAHRPFDDERRRAPQAGDVEARENVPSAHVRGLSDAGAVGGALLESVKRGGVRLRFEKRAADQDLHDVRAGLQAARHVELVRHEHVRRFADFFAVQENVGERVDPVEAQDGAAAFRHGRRVELAGIEPLVALEAAPLERGEPLFRRRQQARAGEVELAAAGNFGGHGSARGNGGKTAHRAGSGLGKKRQAPISVEGNACRHRQDPRSGGNGGKGRTREKEGSAAATGRRRRRRCRGRS